MSAVDTRAVSASFPAEASTARSDYVAHIDGLRAIAVLAVIVYHLRKSWLPGGFAGVDIFFAISGFVVSASVARWNGGGLAAFIGYFYARRVQRILPALIVCLLTTSLATTLFVPESWLSQSNEGTGLYAFFGLSNVFLATHRESYFAPVLAFNPYMHTWSLGVEEQFYLAFPLLFFAWTRGAPSRALSIGVFAIASLASGAAAFRLSGLDPTRGFFLITARFWELGAGVIAYQILASRRTDPGAPARADTRIATIGAATSLIAVAISFAISTPRSFSWPGALLPVAATIGLLVFLHRREGSPLARALGAGPLAAIGKMSYSLYLWHWPVFALLRWTIGLESAAAAVSGVALTFALAAVSWRFVEQPFRYARWLRHWPRVAVVAAAIVVVVVASRISAHLLFARPALSLSTVARHGEDWYPNAPDGSLRNSACRLETRYETARGIPVTIYSRAGCEKQAANAPRVFVVGDSHASAYTRMLSSYALDTGAAVFLYAQSGCPFLGLQPEPERSTCLAHGRAALADIGARAKAHDVVFLPSLRLARFVDQYGGVDARARERMTGAAAAARREKAESVAGETLAPLAAAGLRIILEAPKPIFRAPPFRCADWFDRGNPVCAPGLTMSRAELERYRRPVLDVFARIEARVPGVGVWDPFPLLCPDETCTAYRDGRPLYFDGDHISGFANALLLPSFRAYVSTPAGEVSIAASAPAG